MLWNLLAALALLWQRSRTEILILHAAWQCQGKRWRQVVSHFLPHAPYCSSCSFCVGAGQSCQPWAAAARAAAVAVAHSGQVSGLLSGTLLAGAGFTRALLTSVLLGFCRSEICCPPRGFLGNALRTYQWLQRQIYQNHCL